MKKQPIFSVISAFLISGVALTLIYFGYFFMTFDLAGGETLARIESQKIVLFILTICVLGVTFSLLKYYLSIGKKHTAIGLIILPILLFGAVSYSCLDTFLYQEPFDKTVWLQEKWKPLNMAKTLVKKDELIGLSADQVQKMLGEPNEAYSNEENELVYFSYLVEEDWTMLLRFDDKIVVSTNLRLPFLGI